MLDIYSSLTDIKHISLDWIGLRRLVLASIDDRLLFFLLLLSHLMLLIV